MNENKPVLSIETSESICGACVYFDDDKYYESIIRLRNVHAEKLFEAIDYVIKSAGIETNDLSSIAISAGPGSFTGLRIGMSAAKGIAFGLSLPIIPVPTFEALAFELSSVLPHGAEFIIANKVNTEEIYYAKFRNTSNLLDNSNNYIFVDKLKIINIAEFSEISKDCIIFGNVNKTGRNSAGFENITGKPVISAPSPFFLARWAKHYGTGLMTNDYDFLEPNYLKNFIIKERKNV